MLAVGDILRQPGTSEMVGFADKLAVPHAGGFSDLQVRGAAACLPWAHAVSVHPRCIPQQP